MIEVPLMIDEAINAIENTEVSHINMSIQVKCENIKNDQLIKVPYRNSNHKNCGMQEPTYHYQKVHNQSQCCTYISKHLKTCTTQN